MFRAYDAVARGANDKEWDGKRDSTCNHAETDDSGELFCLRVSSFSLVRKLVDGYQSLERNCNDVTSAMNRFALIKMTTATTTRTCVSNATNDTPHDPEILRQQLCASLIIDLYLFNRDNSASLDGARAVADLFRSGLRVRIAYVNFTAWSNAGIALIAKGMMDFDSTSTASTLHKLVDSNSNVIMHGSSALRELDLNSNGIHGSEGIAPLMHALSTSSALRTLSALCLSFNRLGDQGACTIASYLDTDPSCRLRQLYLSANAISDEGAVALFTALERHRHLTYLALNDNSIGDDGARACARMLRSGTSMLRVLLLRENLIGATGMWAIVDALREVRRRGTPRHLRKLAVEDNLVEDDDHQDDDDDHHNVDADADHYDTALVMRAFDAALHERDLDEADETDVMSILMARPEFSAG